MSDLKEVRASRSVMLLVEVPGPDTDDAGTMKPAEDARKMKASKNDSRSRNIVDSGAWVLGRLAIRVMQLELILNI